MMLSPNFRFIWPSGFREDFLEIGQPETRTKNYIDFLTSALPNLLCVGTPL
jgi:hypothetical protein